MPHACADGGQVVTVDNPPTRWGAHMRVRHQGSLAVGDVLSVDLEEDLVTVDVGEEMPRTWRIENVREVNS